MDDSVSTCDEIIKETFATNFNEKKTTYKTQNCYILLAFFACINYYSIINSY